MLYFNACDALIAKQSVLTIVQILASSEKHKINPMFFCLFGFFFGWRGSVVVYFKQAWCWKVQSLNSENSTLPFIKMLFTESINKQLLMCKFPRSLRGIHWLAGPAWCRNSFNCWVNETEEWKERNTPQCSKVQVQRGSSVQVLRIMRKEK